MPSGELTQTQTGRVATMPPKTEQDGPVCGRPPTWRTAGLLVVAIWAFARAYYFAFYVIEKYVDPGYKFSGLISFMRYLNGRRGR